MLRFLRHFSSSKLDRVERVLSPIFLVSCILVMAVTLTLRYGILPDIEKYHSDVTRMASDAVGLPVKIDKIEAGWRGLRPYLRLGDVRLMDAQGNSALALKRVDLVVSWMTLLSGELRLHALEVNDPELGIRRDRQGHLHVAGLQLKEQQSGDDKLSDWLLHQSSIVVRDGHVTWLDELHDRPLLEFSQVQFRLSNSGRRHRFALHLAPPANVSSPLDVRGILAGSSFSDLEDWHGELYAQLAYADVTAWTGWLTLPDELSNARGGLRAWLAIENGKFKRVTADLDLGAVKSRLAANMPELDLTALRGRVDANKMPHGFEISTQRLSLQMRNGFKLQPTDFHLRLTGVNDNAFAAGDMGINFIELSDLTTMAEYIPLDQELKQKLADFAPRGHLADLRMVWSKNENKPTRFDVKARFDDISLRGMGAFPGVENLSGQVNGSDSSGSLVLNAPHLKLDAPQWFLEPLAFDAFAAKASWQRKPSGWDVKLNEFSASNADLDGTAYGSYQTIEHGPGVLDVTLNLTRASMRHAVRYLPKELLGKKTMSWLQSGLQGGEADDVHLRLRGDLNDFPFPENKKGVFRVEAKANDVIVDYVKGWPRVEDAAVKFLIEGRKLQLDAASAMMSGARVQKINVTIPDLLNDELLLQVKGEASTETRHILSFIKHSPVRGYINGFTDNATARGDGRLDVQLDIPLGDKPVKLNGNYHFADNELTLGEAIPSARAVTGDMAFTESSVRVKDMRAQILGGPATLTVKSENDGALKVKLSGRANMDVWNKLNPHPALQSLSGSADWSTDVSVRDGQYVVETVSDLRGLGSNLPAPLSKRPNEAVPVKFEMRNSGASQDVMWLQYGDQISARLLRADDKLGVRTFKRGYVNFGPARHLVDKDGIWVVGALPVLSLEGWRGVFQSDSSGASPQIDGIDVIIQKLVGYNSVINGVNVHARNRNGVLTAQLSSKEMNGELNWFPQGKGRVVARMKNAVFWNAEKDKRAEASKTSSNISMPVVDVVVDNFTFRNRPLGKLELHASQFEKDVLLDHFKLASPDGVLVANGKWGMDPAQTHLIIKLELNDVGNVLARFGYPNSIKSGNGVLDCDLTWGGAPDDFALANLDGHLGLKMAKGQFLKLDPGAGKLLSVLSLQSLPKRITLDFTDVFSQGFEFDNMDGMAQVRQGVMSTDDFKINGSAAAVALSGQVDLNRETQSLRVRVLPTIGNSVSLLAFAAGPAVGAGVFLANKILRNPLDKLVSFEYNVTGSWIDPKVEKAGQVKTSP